ncbi:MAG: cyclic nucleotide-binding domain-containing protein [Alphaproteobacteria bacterium]|jgi:CRP-like cAMP-binding protein|nr:cyclic nucleotide-binding domain-containing protein [Alphaproteobacteria bacterium]
MSDIPSAKPLPSWAQTAAAESMPEEKQAGEVIIEEGEVGRMMYVVLSGEVRVMLGESEGETMGPGGIVGEMALLDEPIRSASVVATEDTRLARIGTELFLRLVREDPAFALFVMSTLARRLRRMTELLRD